MSQLVRQRCQQEPANEDEALLLQLVAEVKAATHQAKRSLQKGITEAERVLKELKAS